MLRTVLVLFILFLILVWVFSYSSVQTWAGRQATERLNEQFDINVSIDKIKISYSGDVVINDALALDERQDTMIYFKELETSILGFGAMMAGSPNLGDTEIDDLILNIRRYKGEPTDNLTVFIEKLSSEPTGEPVQPFELTTGDLTINNATVRVIDEDLSIPESFIGTNMNVETEGLHILGSVIESNITHADFILGNGSMKTIDGVRETIVIKDLSADFQYTPSQITAADLSIETDASKIKGNLIFDYKREDLAEFLTKVQWDFKIDTAQVATNEIRKFYDEIVPNESVALSGYLKGTLNDFKVDGMRASTLNDISIDGDMHFKNLVENEEEFFIEGDFRNLQISNRDLKTFLPNVLGDKMPKQLDELGTIKAEGYASVDANRLVTRMRGSTRKGNFDTDLTLTEIQSGNVGYVGNVQLKSVDLGAILDDDKFGKTTLNLNVSGRGFTPDKAISTLRGSAIEFTYNGYRYRNIVVNGNLKKPIFNGKISVNDPNLKMKFNGLVDMSEKINKYDFNAQIQYANLDAINIFKRDSISELRGNIIMDMEGTSLDDATGDINITETSYKNQNGNYVFDDLVISSSFSENVRLITVKSTDVIEGEISGEFKVREIPELFKNSIGTVYTNYKSENITDDQYLNYEFQIYDKIVDLVFPEIELGENTILKGRVSSNESEFKMTFRTPMIDAYGVYLDKVNVQVDNQNPIFNTYIKIDEVRNGVYDVRDFQLINVTKNDTLLFRTEFENAKRPEDKYKLSLYHTVDEKSRSVVGIRKSNFRFQGKKWQLNKNSDNIQFTFDHDFKKFSLDSLSATNGQEKITLAGLYDQEEAKEVYLDFEKVRISSLVSPIDSLKLRGQIDGTLKLEQINGNYAPTSDFTVNSFEVNDTPLGDFDLKVNGDESLTNYIVHAQLRDDDTRTFVADGVINTAGEESTYDVDATFNDFNLISFSPLGGVVLDNIRGFADGKATLTGKLSEPQINGDLTLRNAGLRLPYLNTDFDFQELANVTITPEAFEFEQIELTDTKFGTKGILNGSIEHKNFGFWELDLALESDRLLVLDTDLTPESLYYGTAFIDGSATITGPTSELFIDVTATTSEDTVFKIPIDDGESLGDTSAIYFLSPEEKAARISGELVEIKEINGLELRFDLRVTPVAEVEITVDPTNGSYLRGSGYGNLLIEINTNGKFIMNGDFIATEGIYNFKYAGIVNKEFTITPGGTVDWNGDPTKANIDVSAVYSTRANPSILLDNPNLNAQIPVEVVTYLEGDLTFFDPEFQIRFPNTNSVVSSELQYRLDDRAERQLQALSLITSGSFYNPNSIGQNAVTGNVVENVTGIVNDLVSNQDSQFDFGVSYEASERNPNSALQRSDRFGITLSTQISDRVLINGKLGVPVGTTNATERAVIGNVEIEFLLNDDGTLRLKLFNRENTLQQFGQQEDYTQGLGLQYQVNFDSIAELYEKIFKKKMSRETETEKTAQEQASGPGN